MEAVCERPAAGQAKCLPAGGQMDGKRASVCFQSRGGRRVVSTGSSHRVLEGQPWEARRKYLPTTVSSLFPLATVTSPACENGLVTTNSSPSGSRPQCGGITEEETSWLQSSLSLSLPPTLLLASSLSLSLVPRACFCVVQERCEISDRRACSLLFHPRIFLFFHKPCYSERAS